MTAEGRGRLPSHVAQLLVTALGDVMQRERRAQRVGARKRAARLARSRAQIAASLVQHWRSYDMVNRPVTMFHPAQRFTGAGSWSEVQFFEDFGFWKDGFAQVVRALALLPTVLQCKTRCSATREQALMVLLKRWRDPRPWSAVAAGLRASRQWCTEVYRTVHELLSSNYLPLLKVIDFKRVVQHAQDWAAAVEAKTQCEAGML